MDISIFFTLNGVEREIHPTIINSFIIVAVLSIFAIVMGKKFDKADATKTPTKVMLWTEIFVEAIENLTVQTMGPANIGFAPYIGTIAAFLAVANLSGLLGFTPPASDYNVTLALSLMTFFLIQYNKIKFNGLGDSIKGLFEPIAILFPINVLGDISTPISLSFRLFGNILSGVIIMTLVYSAFSGLANLLLPFIAPVFHGYFDVFAGLIQTFIFIMLSMVFISDGIGERE